MDVLVALRIQSESLTIEQLSEIVGVEPTRSTRKGAPVSSRNPDGPTRPQTTWRFEVRESSDDAMTPAFEQLRPLLARLAGLETVDETRDVVMMLHARDMGALHQIEPRYVELMARARTGLVIDVYNDTEDEAGSDVLGVRPS